MKWIRDLKKVSRVFELFLVVLLGVMIFSTGFMTFRIQKELEDNAIASTKSVFDKSINLLNSEILTAHNALYRYSRYISWDDKEKSVVMLDAFLQEYGGSQAIFMDLNGVGYDSSGNAVTVSKLPFQDFVLSKGEEGFSPCYMDKDGTYVTAMGVSILKNGVQAGAFYVIFPMEKFSGNVLAKSIRNEGYFYLLDRRTNTMFSATYNIDNPIDAATTLTDLMKDTSFSRNDLNSKVFPPMDLGEHFLLKGSFKGESYYFFFLPVEENPSWYMCGIMPKSVIKEESSNTLSLIGSIIEMLVLLCVLIVALILYFLLRRQLSEKKERKEKEFQNAIYKAFSEKSDVVVCIFDKDTHTLEQVFQNSLRILGRPNEDYLSNPELLKELCEMVDFSLYNRLMLNQITQDEIKEFSMKHPLTKETPIIRFTIKTGIVIAGKQKYMFYFEDITQSVKTQKALQDAALEAQKANKAKSEFLSNMSHEIRTPMNAIIGMLEILERNLDNRLRMEDCVSKIRLSATHLLTIINDILDISRIESGKVSLSITQFSLSSLVSNVSSIIRPQAEAENKHHTFAIHIHNLSHDNYLGDWMRLNQILINILNNSVKYTLPDGYITLDISGASGVRPGTSQICFTVQDNGIGMSKEFQARLGKPFEQEQSQLHIQEGGTGLGLSIVFHLVAMMGGSVAIDSQVGIGTSISITLELQQADETLSVEAESFSGMNVLIADNDPLIIQDAVSALKRFQVNVDSASTVSDTADMILAKQKADNGYDLAIIDCSLDGGGFKSLLSMLPACLDLHRPVFCITFYNYAEAEQEQVEEADIQYMDKPFFSNRLYELLNRVKNMSITQSQKGKKSFGPVKSLPDLNILLVEDNDLNREIALEFLHFAKLNSDCAVNGQEAVDLFVNSKEGTYDLILMDIQMPVMDGLSATVKIRESAHLQAKSIPILAMTANAFEEDVNRCLNAGMNGHLAKPLDVKLFYEMIAKFSGR